MANQSAHGSKMPGDTPPNSAGNSCPTCRHHESLRRHPHPHRNKLQSCSEVMTAARPEMTPAHTRASQPPASASHPNTHKPTSPNNGSAAAPSRPPSSPPPPSTSMTSGSSPAAKYDQVSAHPKSGCCSPHQSHSNTHTTHTPATRSLTVAARHTDR